MGKDSDDGSTLGFGRCQPFNEFWKNLDRCQHQMFSRMARMKRKWSADESWLDLKKRKVRMGRYLVQKHSIYSVTDYFQRFSVGLDMWLE